MISFRPASINDYSAIARLHAKSWQQNYRGVFSDQFLNKEVLADRLAIWKDRFENPKSNQFVIIAEIESSLVGFVCCNIDDDAAYGTLIDNLHVDSKFIGQRIGEKLMVNAALYLEEKNRSSMYLWVLTGNSKAIKFYERMGGRPMETVNDFDIGDREVIKTRYYWSNLKFIQDLRNKEIGK